MCALRRLFVAVLEGCSEAGFVWAGALPGVCCPECAVRARGELPHAQVPACLCTEGDGFEQPKLPAVGSSPVVVNVLYASPWEGCELGSSAEPLPEEGLMLVNSTFQLWQPSVSFSVA